MSEVSVWLDVYDDIFSDFDPHPYSERLISDDFIFIAKREARERTTGTIELRLLIPANKHDAEVEKIIKKRLHEQFNRQHKQLLHELKKSRLHGALTACVGLTLMFASTYIRTAVTESFLHNLMFVILEPGGWFMTWYGLDNIFNTERNLRSDVEFYAKMSRCHMKFMTY